MVSESEVKKIILEQFPKFESYLQEEKEIFWGEENESITAFIASFSHYIKDLIIDNPKSNQIEQSLLLAEYFMEKGSDKVQDAVATCFLENLTNAISWKRIPSSSIVPYLGPKSKDYCKGWDEFTGTKTESLWDE